MKATLSKEITSFPLSPSLHCPTPPTMPDEPTPHIPVRFSKPDGDKQFASLGAVRSASGFVHSSYKSTWRLQSGFSTDHPLYGRVYVHATDGVHSIVWSHIYGWQEVASFYHDPNPDAKFRFRSKSEDDEEYDPDPDHNHKSKHKRLKLSFAELKVWLAQQQ